MTEAEARRRLVEAQQALDVAQARVRAAEAGDGADAMAALERAKAALVEAGRQLREVREAGTRQKSAGAG